jgi:hypothetical protein
MKTVSDDTLDTLIDWVDKLSAGSEHTISRGLYRDVHAALSELRRERVRNQELQKQIADPQAPIARLHVSDTGLATLVSAHLYAPGLPPGEHDVYLDPSAPGITEEVK